MDTRNIDVYVVYKVPFLGPGEKDGRLGIYASREAADKAADKAAAGRAGCCTQVIGRKAMVLSYPNGFNMYLLEDPQSFQFDK